MRDSEEIFYSFEILADADEATNFQRWGVEGGVEISVPVIFFN